MTRAAGFPGITGFATFPLAVASLVAGAWSLIACREKGFGPTLLLLGAVVSLGLALIYGVSRRVGDDNLLKLGHIFVLKLAFLLLVLCVSWQGSLDSTGPIREGDQQRFYYQADQLASTGFQLESLPSLNYTGVLFIYGAVFALFGHNPFAPALVNSFATLVTVLLLIRVAYRINPRYGRYGWLLGLCMVVPEVAMHDAMTSRDTLVLSLLSVPVLALANFLLGEATRGRAMAMAALGVPAILLLAVVRMPAVFPVIASVVAILLMFRRKLRTGYVGAIVVVAVLVLVAAPRLSEKLGGYRLDYRQMAKTTALDPDPEFLVLFSWNRRSIGRLLIPRTTLQAIALTPLRVIAYLVAPLPTFGVSSVALARGDWFHWVRLLIVLSSILYIALFPLALASLAHALTGHPAGLMLQIPFWITIVAVVSGTALIHERYRLMAVPLLLGCVWLGTFAPRGLVIRSYAVWAIVLVVGGGTALAYKSAACAVPRFESQTTSVTIPAGRRVTLQVLARGSDIEYQWFGGASGYVFAAVKGANRSSLTVSPPVTSTYWVRVFNTCGHVDSRTITVAVESPARGDL